VRAWWPLACVGLLSSPALLPPVSAMGDVQLADSDQQADAEMQHIADV
jgi:hypothetical protein